MRNGKREYALETQTKLYRSTSIAVLIHENIGTFVTGNFDKRSVYVGQKFFKCHSSIKNYKFAYKLFFSLYVSFSTLVSDK